MHFWYLKYVPVQFWILVPQILKCSDFFFFFLILEITGRSIINKKRRVYKEKKIIKKRPSYKTTKGGLTNSEALGDIFK